MKNVENEISDEVKNCFENETIWLNKNKTSFLNVEIKAKISINMKISKNVDLNFFW